MFSGDKEREGSIGSTSDVDKIEVKYPGYLHYIYRYATNTFGAKYSFELLSIAINKKVIHQQRRGRALILIKYNEIHSSLQAKVNNTNKKRNR